MQKISIEYLRPGMRVARPIYHSTGQLLLKRGTVLTAQYISRLARLYIPSVYVSLEHAAVKADKPASRDILDDAVRQEALQNVSAMFKCFQQNEPVEQEQLSGTVSMIVHSVMNNQGHLIQALDIRSYDDYTFSHSVNVCAMSSMLGVLLGYNKKELQELALGALLHDVGKLKIPLSILNKKDRLTDEEFEQMKLHPVYGYNILRKSMQCPIPICKIALQHHEKCCGGGYPYNLSSEKISSYAKVIAIADVFDALTAERVYKKAFPAWKAYEIMCHDRDNFDPEMLQHFFANVAIYPIGTTVQMAGGEYGVIVDFADNCVTAPTIQVIADAEQQPVSETRFIQLTNSSHNEDFRVLEDDAVLDLLDALNQHDFAAAQQGAQVK